MQHDLLDNLDNATTVQSLKDLMERFVTDRNWQQYHSAKNLSMDIACEAAELMEYFMWLDSEESNKALSSPMRTEIEHEVADVLMGIFAFANRFSLDLTSIIQRKLVLTGQKYPVDKAYSKRTKYTHL